MLRLITAHLLLVVPLVTNATSPPRDCKSEEALVESLDEVLKNSELVAVVLLTSDYDRIPSFRLASPSLKGTVPSTGHLLPAYEACLGHEFEGNVLLIWGRMANPYDYDQVHATEDGQAIAKLVVVNGAIRLYSDRLAMLWSEEAMHWVQRNMITPNEGLERVIRGDAAKRHSSEKFEDTATRPGDETTPE